MMILIMMIKVIIVILPVLVLTHLGKSKGEEWFKHDDNGTSETVKRWRLAIFG